MSKFMSSLRGGKSSSSKDTSILDFVLGIVLMVVGVYCVFKNTSVGVSRMQTFFGTGLPRGIATIPLLIGIAILFFNHRYKIGWGVVIVGVLVLIIQIILSVTIIFLPTSLLNYLLMFGGIFGGLGLLAKALLK